jgi:ABC-2 type transport system ATP-binding protein
MAEQYREPVINAIGLGKEFRDFWNRPKAKAVNDVDFTVNEGEVVGLLGPNGSGKSTTVKMILGLLYPTAGSLQVFGRSPRDVDTKKLIGYLPEETYLYKYLNAIETLEFFGSLFGIHKQDCRRRCDQLLEMVGLSHVKRRRVGEFSKGMQRRIGLAQAMINDPALLILDEPTSGLDPLGCREVKDLILNMKKRGKTVFVTSHLLSDIEDICDRVIILYGGKIRATGSLNELLTINEASRITTPLLTPEVTEKVVSILRESLKGEDFQIDKPRMTLENFFLDVIEKARADSVENAGVVSSGGKIADYLSDEDQVVSGLLDEVADYKLEEDAEEQAAAEEAEEKAEKEAVAAVLSDIAEPVAPEPEPEEKPEEDLSAANDKLNELLSDRLDK